MAEKRRVLIVASNPSVSAQTGWPIGFWWAELTHPYWEFTEAGYTVDIASPDGGKIEADAWSDPRHESGYSAQDLLSLGFINSAKHAALLDKTVPLADVKRDDYDAVFFVGGQGPMYTFYEDARVHELVRGSYEAGKITAIICHATCVLLKVRLSSGDLLVKGKTSPTPKWGSGSSRSGSRPRLGRCPTRISSCTDCSRRTRCATGT
jgi:putative intracellular protease/amidase